jgi:hypothetical protein
MRKRIAALLALLMAACAQPPVQEEVTIELQKGGMAVVTSQTTFELKPKNDAERLRIETARADALSGNDDWSVRFARLTPESDRVTYERARGELERVTHSARIRDTDVERLFSDTSITLQLAQGDDYRELQIYPGSSGRATREQQRHFAEELQAWSGEIARYFKALDHMYDYLQGRPERARYLFGALFDEKNPDETPVVVTEEEQPYVDAVSEAMDAIGARMDNQQERALSFAEEADLIYNAFPARLTIIVPGDIVARDGFTQTKDANSVTVEPVDLFAAIAALEGRWVTPDPLAVALRDENATAEQMAKLPRRSDAVVSAKDVATALEEQLSRSKTYRVRWRG